MNFQATAEMIVADPMCSCSETAMEDAIVDALKEAHQAGKAEQKENDKRIALEGFQSNVDGYDISELIWNQEE